MTTTQNPKEERRVLQYSLNIDTSPTPCPNTPINAKYDVNSIFPISIDVTDIAAIQSHLSDLPIAYRNKLEALDQKRARKPHLNNTDNYFDQKRIIALSDIPQTNRILSCAFGKNSLCNTNRLCHTCASLKGEEKVAKWQNQFGRASWTMLTLSYSEYLGANGTDFIGWHRHLDAIKFALESAYKAGDIPGAMWREELAIEVKSSNGLPLFNLKPHAHALIPCASISKELEAKLIRWIVGYRDHEAEGITMTPDLDVKAISNVDEYKRKIKYLNKVIDLVGPYKQAINGIVNPTEIFFAHLNRNARNLVESLTEGCRNRQMTRHIGIMNSSSPRSFLRSPAV